MRYLETNLILIIKYCRKGLIYFPDFCELVLTRFRESEDEEEDFFQSMLKDLEGSFRYPLAREGVTAPGGHVCLANSRQKFSNIVGLTALRLAFSMGYEYHKVVQWFLY